MPEVVVSCGGTQTNAAAADGRHLVLSTLAPEGSPERVNLNLGHLTKRMVANVPDRLADLVEIAAYVYCADQFARRDTPEMQRMGAAWRRSFRFHIPVRDLATWQRPEVVEALAETLGYLSDDDYAFRFTPASDRSHGLQPYLDLHGEGAPAGFDPDRVALFSGGLDSFAGASEALLKRGERVAMVSHQASPMLRSKQVELVDALRNRTDAGQLFHLSILVNKGQEPALEYTQRARSFLFATLGFVVARLFRKAEILFYENGVVSLNLPFAEHVLGARATRTTHSQVLAGLSRLFSLLADEPMQVRNPYFWLTKADVVGRIVTAGCGDLIPLTFSCTRVRQATRDRQHCGVCSQCVDRRFGVLAAGEDLEPADLYAFDLFKEAREPGPDLVLVQSYVLAATRFATMTEAGFLSRYGQVYQALPYLGLPHAEGASRLHQLHIRHGQSVSDVLDRELSRTSSLLASLALPESSLLALVRTQVPRQPAFVDAAEEEAAPSVQAAAIAGRELKRPIQFALDLDRRRVVFQGGATLTGKAFALVQALFGTYREDREANRKPDEYRHVPTKKLIEVLGVQEQSFRQIVRRARERLREEFRVRLGATIADDDVIQSLNWQGYWLNPYLQPQPLALIAASAEGQAGECHDPKLGKSRLPDRHAVE